MFQGHCESVTQEVIKKIHKEGTLPAGYTVSEHKIQYKMGHHVALLFTDPKGEEYIMDFTARQYDDWLAGAMVEPRERWEKVIDYYVATNYRDTRIE